MLCLTASIAFYIILISFVIPSCFGHATDDDQYIDDSIMLVMMSCAALVEVCHDMTNQYKNDRRFVSRKRRFSIAIILEKIETGENCEK